MDKKIIYIKTFLYFILIAFLFSCTKETKKKTIASKTQNTFIIKGHSSKEIEAKYLFLIDADKNKVDSTKIEQHSFTLRGKINESKLFYLQLNNFDKKHPFILENTDYTVLINSKDAMILGGSLNEEFFSYKRKKRMQQKQLGVLYEQFSYKDISLKTYLKKLDSINKKEKKEFYQFISNNNNNILPAIILDQGNFSSKELIQLRKDLIASEHTKGLKKLDLKIENLKAIELNKKIARRKPAPLFSGINLLGSRTYLENITKGKKLFLIDFWASWCPPCRVASPKIKKMYEQYSIKGFDILSVSEDRSVAEWKDGILIDGLESWHHIYDDYNRISSLYNVTALPHMVLIDENGKMVKNKISLSELEIELEKTFQ